MPAKVRAGSDGLSVVQATICGEVAVLPAPVIRVIGLKSAPVYGVRVGEVLATLSSPSR